MKKSEWNEGLDHLDPDLIETYVEQKDGFRKNKKQKSVWLRIGAIAACLALIVGAVGVLPRLQNKIPVWDQAQYSAEEVAALFSGLKGDAVATNAYTTVSVPDAKYLYIDPITDDEYLPVYQYHATEKKINEAEFEAFINGFLPKLAESVDVEPPRYEIKEEEDLAYRGKTYLDYGGDFGDYRMWIRQRESDFSFSIYKSWSKGDPCIVLDGETVQIDQRLSDEEILSSLQSIKNKLFAIFNVSFPDAKIVRRYGEYSEHGAETVSVYFYQKTEPELDPTQKGWMPSDYIEIQFDNISNFSGDTVGDGILTDATIYYKKNRTDSSKEYEPIANAKRISLEDAEALLYHGYVFGGHVCSLCMKRQDKISFQDYDFVDLEYVFGYDPQTGRPTVGMPFYAFYKEIKTAQNGNTVYAKTYVAAIEVSGYDKYFEKEKKNHQDINDIIG